MIPAAVIIAVVLLAGTAWLFWYLGGKSAASALVKASAQDEKSAALAASMARAKIEAEDKAKLAAIPGETTDELAKDLWGKE